MTLSSSRSSRRRALDGAVDQGERIVAQETQRLRRCQRIVAVLGAPTASAKAIRVPLQTAEQRSPNSTSRRSRY
ncbi:MAG: hypothetical protein VW338_14060 [Rhodospirillaceae bacterium]